MTAALPLEVKHQEPDHKRQPGQDDDRPGGEEHPQRAVHGVRTDDGRRGMLEVVAHAGHQPGGSDGGVGAHRHGDHFGLAVAGLDERLERVGVV